MELSRYHSIRDISRQQKYTFAFSFGQSPENCYLFYNLPRDHHTAGQRERERRRDGTVTSFGHMRSVKTGGIFALGSGLLSGACYIGTCYIYIYRSLLYIYIYRSLLYIYIYINRSLYYSPVEQEQPTAQFIFIYLYVDCFVLFFLLFIPHWQHCVNRHRQV